MATGILYVDSNAAGAADGTSWADAYLTVNTALGFAGATRDLWVATDHQEYSADILSLGGTNSFNYASPTEILRVDKVTNLYSPAFGDVTAIDNFRSGGNNLIRFRETNHWYGFQFRADGDFAVELGRTVYFTDCNIEVANGTLNTGEFDMDNLSRMHLVRCRLHSKLSSNNVRYNLATTGEVLHVGCVYDVRNHVDGFFRMRGARDAQLGLFEDCDGSAISNDAFHGGSAWGSTNATDMTTTIGMNYCKVRSVEDILGTPLGVPILSPSATLSMYSCGEGVEVDSNRTHIQTYHGVVDESLGTFYDGGFVDQATALPMSYRMTPNTNCDTARPLKSPKIGTLITTTGMQTLEVQILVPAGIALDASECWFELSKYVSGTFLKIPDRGNYYSGGGSPPILASGTDWTSDTLLFPSERKLQLTVDIPTAGVYYATVFLGKFILRLHVNPILEVA